MKDELRALRKEAVKPVSRMKKADIASELEKLRGMREETPPVASTAGPKPKKMEAKEKDIKVAKEKEYPAAPVEEKKKAAKESKKATVVGGSGAVGVETKMSKKDKLLKMLAEMSDSD